MTTILIWLGSGFAFAVGVVSGIMLTIKKMEKSNVNMNEIQARSLEALNERNDIGAKQLYQLTRIAEAFEQHFNIK